LSFDGLRKLSEIKTESHKSEQIKKNLIISLETVKIETLLEENKEEILKNDDFIPKTPEKRKSKVIEPFKFNVPNLSDKKVMMKNNCWACEKGMKCKKHPQQKSEKKNGRAI
jgi:hypothetical protein